MGWLEATLLKAAISHFLLASLCCADAADISYLEQTKRLVQCSIKKSTQLARAHQVCKQAVALTTVFDIAEGKAVRKLESGEVLEQLDAEDKKDEARAPSFCGGGET
eukprot:1369951-Amphidinium_carterae.1